MASKYAQCINMSNYNTYTQYTTQLLMIQQIFTVFRIYNPYSSQDSTAVNYALRRPIISASDDVKHCAGRSSVHPLMWNTAQADHQCIRWCETLRRPIIRWRETLHRPIISASDDVKHFQYVASLWNQSSSKSRVKKWGHISQFLPRPNPAVKIRGWREASEWKNHVWLRANLWYKVDWATMIRQLIKHR